MIPVLFVKSLLTGVLSCPHVHDVHIDARFDARCLEKNKSKQRLCTPHLSDLSDLPALDTSDAREFQKILVLLRDRTGMVMVNARRIEPARGTAPNIYCSPWKTTPVDVVIFLRGQQHGI